MVTYLPPMTTQEKRALVRVIAPFAPIHGVHNRANLQQNSCRGTIDSTIDLAGLSTFFRQLAEVNSAHHYSRPSACSENSQLHVR